VTVFYANRPLWQRGLVEQRSMGFRARLALAELLWRCGESVTLVEIHTWPKRVQGAAYLWALDRLDGVTDAPKPWVRT
jgi:hypothetical protein